MTPGDFGHDYRPCEYLPHRLLRLSAFLLQVDAYLLDLEVDELPGVGWNMCHKLKDLGIASVRHVRSSSKDVLQKELGSKTGVPRIAKPPLCGCICTCTLLQGPRAIWPECSMCLVGVSMGGTHLLSWCSLFIMFTCRATSVGVCTWCR